MFFSPPRACAVASRSLESSRAEGEKASPRAVVLQERGRPFVCGSRCSQASEHAKEHVKIFSPLSGEKHCEAANFAEFASRFQA